MNNKRTLFKELPLEIENVDKDAYEKFKVPNLKQFRGILVGPKKYYCHPCYKYIGLEYYNFQSRSDDVYILGVMRSGTTLVSELAYLLVNDLNFQKAAGEDLHERVPNLEAYLASKIFIGQKAVYGVGLLKFDTTSLLRDHVKTLDGEVNQRCIRSHLPISLLSPHIFDVGAKVIYCARNPKDVIVSNYHFYRLFQEEHFNSFKDYFRMFKSSKLAFLPYFEHLKEGWARRNNPNFMFIFYEDLTRNKRKYIKKISDFLDIYVSEEALDELEEHLDINKFKTNSTINLDSVRKMGFLSKNESFIRKGEIGQWKKYFTGDLEREVDEWIEENLTGTDIDFPDY
ncbi:sulfotransferase 1E1 [Diabrotica virgifera virgifera]|uniref:Estrogen sulfotransferase-like n=1 Tax=Diabrotica virgifera virgifera TaxID=50390 RepID=A0A6P7FC47_DIAVI|nr:sulfotransferase 1E1 [Diabrotica virgifera virgifera]